MKKYVKPELFFENYELSQHIAACDYKMNHEKDDYGCSALGLEGTSFFTSERSCQSKVDDYFCTYNSNDGFVLFAS